VTKLVVIDDHEAMRGGLEVLLAQSGHDVVGAAGNVASAMDLLANGPEVALVDLRLPDGNGIDLTRSMLEREPRLGVILYTGEAAPEHLQEALDAGASGYVLKTADLQELLEAVREVADGGRYVDPRLPPPKAATGRTTRLSPREREVMHLMAEGLTAERVGARIDVSVETVRTHVRNAIRKLGARNRVHAIALALERGEIALVQDDAGGF
jgi:DNA-binding NarL/FixJ family response regulator